MRKESKEAKRLWKLYQKTGDRSYYEKWEQEVKRCYKREY